MLTRPRRRRKQWPERPAHSRMLHSRTGRDTQAIRPGATVDGVAVATVARTMGRPAAGTVVPEAITRAADRAAARGPTTPSLGPAARGPAGPGRAALESAARARA